jgi:hypothetical protein
LAQDLLMHVVDNHTADQILQKLANIDEFAHEVHLEGMFHLNQESHECGKILMKGAAHTPAAAIVRAPLGDHLGRSCDDSRWGLPSRSWKRREASQFMLIIG